jgi:hypothetical protein
LTFLEDPLRDCTFVEPHDYQSATFTGSAVVTVCRLLRIYGLALVSEPLTVCLVFRFEARIGTQESLHNLGRESSWKAVIWKTIDIVDFAEVG